MTGTDHTPDCPDDGGDRYWGRPTLAPGEHLDHEVRVQVRRAQKLAWRQAAKAAEIPLAEWVRRCVAAAQGQVLAPTEPIPVGGPADAALVRQVRALGNNLNQIARRVNEAAKIGLLDTALAEDIHDEITDLKADLRALTATAALARDIVGAIRRIDAAGASATSGEYPGADLAGAVQALRRELIARAATA